MAVNVWDMKLNLGNLQNFASKITHLGVLQKRILSILPVSLWPGSPSLRTILP
jgi:hypothetical protein